MQINKNLKLILRDLHVYDIESCHYTILSNLGYDLDGVDPNDKLQRNIKIGQMMGENPRLGKLLRTTTESVIDDYIAKNNISEDDIVLRQYDGLILTRKLDYTNIGHIPLGRRKTFSKFISSLDRKMYIALDNNNEVSIKGVPHRYDIIDEYYKRMCHISNLSRDKIFHHLQKIKDEIIFSNDTNLFGIPSDQNKCIVFLKGYGEVKVSNSTIRIMDVNEIDKERYFKYYIEPFAKSLVVENLRRQ